MRRRFISLAELVFPFVVAARAWQAFLLSAVPAKTFSSHGMQQCVAMTRALAYNSAVLFRDEFFLALDAFTREQVQ
jgi:ABC-type nitrate/sulfonate/bicarbonate transport system ATPase subunit